MQNDIEKRTLNLHSATAIVDEANFPEPVDPILDYGRQRTNPETGRIAMSA